MLAQRKDLKPCAGRAPSLIGRGKSHAPFLGDGGAAMRCCYPTRGF